jgi:hypothetical protein
MWLAFNKISTNPKLFGTTTQEEFNRVADHIGQRLSGVDIPRFPNSQADTLQLGLNIPLWGT